MEKKPRKSEIVKEKLEDAKLTQAQKTAEAQKLLREKRIQRFNAVAATEEGRFLLKFLMEICGYDKSKVVANSESHVIDLVSTAHNAAMENVYLKIRQYIRREHLIKIELTKQED